MQELIYLSPTKLNRFVSETGRRRPLRSVVIDRVAVTIGDNDKRAKLENRLKEVRNYLAQSALWFGDPEVRPGAWVNFEGELGYSILDSRRSRLFLMSQTPTTLEGNVALLLHGSPQNVLLRASKNAETEALDSYVTNLVRLVDELAELEQISGRLRKTDKPKAVSEAATESEIAAIQLYEQIAERHDGAYYVQGLANVSMVITGRPILLQPVPGELIELSRLVVASPLYVESISRPVLPNCRVPFIT